MSEHVSENSLKTRASLMNVQIRIQSRSDVLNVEDPLAARMFWGDILNYTRVVIARRNARTQRPRL
jgi:hypothetical protein